MIRTLAIIAAVSFVLSVVCLASAIAVAGGPFSIDHDWRFRRGDWAGDPTNVQTRVIIRNTLPI